LHNYISSSYIDICDFSKLSKKIEEIEPDYIFHLAAQAIVRKSYTDPLLTWCSNTFGTINLLQSLRFLKKKCVAILITSDKCYENVEWIWGYRENDRLGGSDPYSASKAATEIAIRSYVDSYFNGADCNIRIGIARAGNVIGGGDWSDDRIVPDAIRAWTTGKRLTLRSPASTRPWQHVLEPLGGYLILALALHSSSELNGEPFNFGPLGEEAKPVGRLIDEMSNYWGNGALWDKSSDSSDLKEANLLRLNCDKASSLLSWSSVWNFHKTVQNTTLWYKNYYESKGRATHNLSLSQIEEFTKDAKLLELFV
jgi:CDP-glucose 4,6-dehydratase